MKKHGGNDHEIIVKRRSKKGHHDEHGGAWKVAFADFTMAMMALFMVLWIVQPQNKQDSAADADMLSNPLVDGGAGVFDGSSRSPLELDGVPIKPAPLEPTETARRDAAGEAPEPAANARRHYGTPQELQELASLMQALASQLDAQANIAVEVVPQGLRILLKDDRKRFMFQRGSTVLTEHFHGLLGGLAQVLVKVDNKLIISGHTDATPYRQKSGYDNWNLSGDRALRARNVLVAKGLPADGVLQVTAHADRMPLRPEAPEDGANRRIEILLLTTRAEALYRELFGDAGSRADYSSQGARLIGPDKGGAAAETL